MKDKKSEMLGLWCSGMLSTSPPTLQPKQTNNIHLIHPLFFLINHTFLGSIKCQWQFPTSTKWPLEIVHCIGFGIVCLINGLHDQMITETWLMCWWKTNQLNSLFTANSCSWQSQFFWCVLFYPRLFKCLNLFFYCEEIIHIYPKLGKSVNINILIWESKTDTFEIRSINIFVWIRTLMTHTLRVLSIKLMSREPAQWEWHLQYRAVSCTMVSLAVTDNVCNIERYRPGMGGCLPPGRMKPASTLSAARESISKHR